MVAGSSRVAVAGSLALLLGAQGRLARAEPATRCTGRCSADAPTPQRGILLQTFVGGPPADAPAVVRRLLQAMGREAPLTGRPLARLIERKISRSGGPLQIGRALRSRVEEGRRAFIEGNYAQAIETLESVRTALLQHTATVATDQGLREALHQTLLFVAHAYLRAQRAQRASERVSEAIRSFPDRELSLVQHSPELVNFYKSIRRQLDRQPRGTLTITTRPRGCMIFIDQRFVGLSPTTTPDLYPGRYRVYVQQGNQRGRIHEVVVDGHEARLDIDFELDRRLQTDGDVGLRFEELATQRREQVALAAAVGRALAAPTTTLVGFQTYEGHRALVGTVVATATAHTIRSALVLLEPTLPSQEVLRRLARFLLGGPSGPGIIVRDVLRRSTDDEARGALFGAPAWRWVAGGVAAGALAGGIVLLAIDGRCVDPPARPGATCRDLYQTTALGLGLTIGGGVLAAMATYLFLRRDPARSETTVAAPLIAPRGGGIAARWRF